MSDYPSEPIGDGNPYYCCSICGKSAPAINDMIEGHYSHCSWRIEQERRSRLHPMKFQRYSEEPVDTQRYWTDTAFPGDSVIYGGAAAALRTKAAVDALDTGRPLYCYGKCVNAPEGKAPFLRTYAMVCGGCVLEMEPGVPPLVQEHIGSTPASITYWTVSPRRRQR